jgi:hypothetical protein
MIHKLTIWLTEDETAVVSRLRAGQSEFPVGLTALTRWREFPDDEHGVSITVRVCRPSPLVYLELYDLDGDIVAGGGVPITEIYQGYSFLPENGDEYIVQIQPAGKED